MADELSYSILDGLTEAWRTQVGSRDESATVIQKELQPTLDRLAELERRLAIAMDAMHVAIGWIRNTHMIGMSPNMENSRLVVEQQIERAQFAAPLAPVDTPDLAGVVDANEAEQP